jgi:hypothetical protein
MMNWNLLEAGVITVHCVGTFVLARLLLRRTRLPEERIMVLASTPVPLAIFAVSISALVSSLTTSPEVCGVDACGMAAVGAWVLLMLSVLLFGLGILIAKAGIHLAKR